MRVPDTEDLPDGFPSVPAYVISDACLWYMTRRTEHREHNMLYHQLAERAIKGARQRRQELYDAYRSVGHYHLETFLCRFHDIFVLYLGEIAEEVFLENPGALPDAHDGDAGESLAAKVSKRLRREAAKPILEFMAFIEAQICPMSLTDEERKATLLMAALRNLVVHNDALPDAKFAKRLAGETFEFTELPGGRIGINEPWLMRLPATLEPVIFRFDDAVVRRFETGRHFRYGTFWIRSAPVPERGGQTP